MNLSEVVVPGTLKPDGTLELDQKPSLAPGRVLVTLQSTPPIQAARGGLTNVIDQIRQQQQARGYQGRSAAEIDAALREGEEDYERKVQAHRTPTPAEE